MPEHQQLAAAPEVEALVAQYNDLRTKLQYAQQDLQKYRAEVSDAAMAYLRGDAIGLSLGEYLEPLLQQAQADVNSLQADIQANQAQMKGLTGNKLDPAALALPRAPSTTTSIGLSLKTDFSRALPANQHFFTNLRIGFDQSNISFGATPAAVTAGSSRQDSWNFAGSATYMLNQAYVSGIAEIDPGRSHFTNGFTTGTGSSASNAYALNGTVGYLFPLWMARPVAALPTKAPPRRDGSLDALLDLSAHVQTLHAKIDSYTDSTGLAFGAQTGDETAVGATARLGALYLWQGTLFQPYASVTYDYATKNSGVFYLLAPTDQVNYSLGRNTVWTEAGVTTYWSRWLNFTASMFYGASSDMNSWCGRVSVKIPFSPFSAPVTR